MATRFSTATAIPQHAPYQHHGYRKSTQYSPNASAVSTPPGNVSPTSPRSTQLALQRHQGIYQPRTAIGIPAALRKTEKPTRSPPKADSGVGSPNSGWHVHGRLSRTGTDDSATPSARVGNEDMLSIYNQEPLSPIAGPITRNHWLLASWCHLCTFPHASGITRSRVISSVLAGGNVSQATPMLFNVFQAKHANEFVQADSSTLVCSASSCQEPFGFFQRRHHCRKCGGIFCWKHSSNQVRLDELARFHPDGALHRACDRCHGSFREWEHLRSSRSNSDSSDNSAAAIAIEPCTVAKRPENPRVGSIAQSLQGAWNWSTF
ncbi:hypothetical protein ACEQ8H_006414 [Pleosporales sp. CAS-2024a]